MTHPLHDRTARALAALGHEATADPEIGTFRIEEDEIATVVVVLSGYDAVGCYTVYPFLLPPERMTELRLLASAATTSLHTSAIEVDEQDRTLSARAAVPCGHLADVEDAVFALMLQEAFLESRRALAVHLDPIAAVLDGTPADEAMAQRMAD